LRFRLESCSFAVGHGFYRTQQECPKEDESDDSLGVRSFVNCPYCWAQNKVESAEDFKVVTSHPPIVEYPSRLCEVKIPFWAFWAVKYPRGVREGSVKCKNCGHDFYVGLFPYDPDDPRNPGDLAYHLRLVKGKEKIERKFLLEDVVDRVCNHLPPIVRHYSLACLVIVLVPSMFFWILPIWALGGFAKLSHDYGFFLLFVLFVCMLILLKRHCRELRKGLSLDKMPLSLSEQYKKSNLSKEAEESWKGWIFGHPFQRTKAPTLCGFVGVVMFVAWQIAYAVNISSTFYETPYPGSYPFTYTSYVLTIASVPFWSVIYFIAGNIVWIFIATTGSIGLITEHTKLEIDPLKETGGTEIFGKMMLSSLYPFAAFGAGIPIAVIWSISQELYVLLICTLCVSLFVLSAAFGFFYPLGHVHSRLKERKEEEQKEILGKISLSRIKKGEMDIKEIVYVDLLLDTSNKVSSMHEWPFKTDTLVKAFSAILAPFASLVIGIVTLYLKL